MSPSNAARAQLMGHHGQSQPSHWRSADRVAAPGLHRTAAHCGALRNGHAEVLGRLDLAVGHLRLAPKQGTVTSSLMLRKLGSYPRQNGLAVALRELGRIERTLLILDWLQSVQVPPPGHAPLKQSKTRN